MLPAGARAERRRRGRGLGGTVSRGSQRLELVVEWTSGSVCCRIGAGLIGCSHNDLELQASTHGMPDRSAKSGRDFITTILSLDADSKSRFRGENKRRTTWRFILLGRT